MKSGISISTYRFQHLYGLSLSGKKSPPMIGKVYLSKTFFDKYSFQENVFGVGSFYNPTFRANRNCFYQKHYLESYSLLPFGSLRLYFSTPNPVHSKRIGLGKSYPVRASLGKRGTARSSFAKSSLFWVGPGKHSQSSAMSFGYWVHSF